MKLELRYNAMFEVRRERYFSDCKNGFSIIFLSDLHLNKFSKKLVVDIIQTIEILNPTIVLLGGDYIDSAKGWIHFKTLLSSLSVRENVFAVAGNHDYYFGLNKISKEIVANNITWVEKKTIRLGYKETTITVAGNDHKYRHEISDFSILLLHKPRNIFKYNNKYNLAFAGHLHGCQIVLWEREKKLYPGKLFYNWNILDMKHGGCHYIVSKGLGDTFPLRFNCKKDLIFVEVIPSNNLIRL